MSDDITKLLNFVGAKRLQEKNRDTEYLLSQEQLEMFEALVRVDERNTGQKWFDAVTAQHKVDILVEREACAKVAEQSDSCMNDPYENAAAREIAAAIRARGNT